MVKSSYLKRVVYIAVPVIIIISYLLILWMLVPYGMFVIILSAMGGYFFPPLGKESVIPLAIAQGADPYFTAISVAMVDITLAMFVFLNFEIIEHIPYIGPKVIRMAKKSKDWVSKRRWIEGTTSFVIGIFVLVPFEGSGGLVASIMASMLGMDKRKAFVSISLGAILGTMLIAKFTNEIIKIFSLDLRLVGTAVIICIFSLLIYKVWCSKKLE